MKGISIGVSLFSAVHLGMTVASPIHHWSYQKPSKEERPYQLKAISREKVSKRRIINREVLNLITRNSDTTLLKSICVDNLLVSTPVAFGTNKRSLAGLSQYFKLIRGTVITRDVINYENHFKIFIKQQPSSEYVSQFLPKGCLYLELNVFLSDDEGSERILSIIENENSLSLFLRALFHLSKVLNTSLIGMFSYLESSFK